MKVGVVLEGGAMRGLYSAGVLDTFLDNDIKLDGAVSVSAGALFGVNYFSKQKGRALRYNKRFMNDKRYISFSSWIKTGNLVSKEFSYYEVPFKLDIFDEEEYKKANVDFYVTLTNVETGESEYVNIKDVRSQMEVLRATSALPFFSEIIEIEGKKYLDGGISDSIPIEKCLKLGYDKVIVILTRPKEYRKKKSSGIITKLVYRKYPKFVKKMLNRYQNYNETLDKINLMEERGEIILIRPSKDLKVKRIEKDLDKLQSIYDLGIKDANEKLEDIKEYLKIGDKNV